MPGRHHRHPGVNPAFIAKTGASQVGMRAFAALARTIRAASTSGAPVSAHPLRRAGLAGLTAALAATGLTLVAAGPASAEDEPLFERLSTFPVFTNSADPDTETVAEITAVTSDGQLLISTDSPGERVTFTDISDPGQPSAAGDLAVGGEPTSVTVYGSYALVVVDTSTDFVQTSGQLLVVDVASRSVTTTIELGGQPDSIALSPSGAVGGTFAVIAIENERDEDVADGELPQPPAGFVSIVALDDTPSDWTATAVDLVPSLSSVDGIYAPTDPEPEYVSVNTDNQAAVTLQENNAIAFVDLPTGTVSGAFTAGTATISGIDTVEDDMISLTGTITDVPREPDAIAWIGDNLVATANEGDLFGGTRGWSIFDAATGALVYDAGNTFEHLAVQHGLYPESRSENKGSEPEGLAVATYGGRTYAFVGAERGNFVAVYDLADPAAPLFVQILPTTNGPEGLLPIPSRGLFVASSEVDVPEDDVRSTITVFGLGGGEPGFPSIVSADQDGSPIPWGALSGLSADPRNRNRLYSITDSYYSPTRILTIDVAQTPALITRALTITENGQPLGVDGEGIFARRQGGFWIAAEGSTGPENSVLRLDATGSVVQRISLPPEIAAGLGSNGLEGITATGAGPFEQVFVALQRPLSTDPAGIARIGRYSVRTQSWSWYGYPLDTGSGIGLSELVALDSNTFAVIERDNRPGTFAEVKRIYTFDIPPRQSPTAPPSLPILTKTLARDLLPDLAADNGWIQEKVEGLTVAVGGQVYVVTDNDGVEDATGETVFLRLGRQRDVFPGS